MKYFIPAANPSPEPSLYGAMLFIITLQVHGKWVYVYEGFTY